MSTDEKFQKQMMKATSKQSHLLHEFQVEFFGALLPGMVFTAAAFMIFTPLILYLTCLNIWDEPFSVVKVLSKIMKSTKDTPHMIWFGLLILWIIVSYMIGCLFMRRDPKEPDRYGFVTTALRDIRKKLKRKNIIAFIQSNRDEKNKDKAVSFLEVEIFKIVTLQKFYEKIMVGNRIGFLSRALLRPSKLGTLGLEKYIQGTNWQKYVHDRIKETGDDAACENCSECQFPYQRLHEYLKSRGHDHLLKLVGWNNNKKEFRSKTAINRLKIKLQYFLPDKYQKISRTEAHVRLSTSMWYVARASFKFALLGLVFWTILVPVIEFLRNGYTLKILFDDSGKKKEIYDILRQGWVAVGLVSFFSFYCFHTIEKFIHYQRVREVFSVLELVSTALIDFPEILADEPKHRDKKRYFVDNRNISLYINKKKYPAQIIDYSNEGIRIQSNTKIPFVIGGETKCSLKYNDKKVSLSFNALWENNAINKYDTGGAYNLIKGDPEDFFNSLNPRGSFNN